MLAWLQTSQQRLVSVFVYFDSEEEGSGNVEVLGVSSHLEASLELILSDSMCNECEFFGLDSDEDVCLSLVSVVSSPLVASCDSARCGENL